MIGKARGSARRLRKGQSWNDNGLALTLVTVGSSISLGLLIWPTTL